MSRKLNYQDVFLDISEEVEIILQVPRIKHSSKKGLHVVVCEKSNIVINSSFGDYGFDDELLHRVTAVQNLKNGWKIKNSGNKKIIAGVVIGRKHIVSVSGLDPKENSAIAILFLSLMEDTDRDYMTRPKVMRRMRCQKEVRALVEYQQSMIVETFFSEAMSNLFNDIKKMKHIQKQKRTGFVVKVYEREFGQCLFQKNIGMLKTDILNELAMNAHMNACWLLSNPNTVTSAERDISYAGAILGKKHIVSVDGLDPNDNSCISIFILSLLENSDEDLKARQFYIKRAMCLNEMYSFVFFLIWKCNRIDIKEEFEWVLPMLEEIFLTP